MPDDNADILNKIEVLEEQLRDLRILFFSKPENKTGRNKVGEQITILNPKTGQGKSGKIIRVSYVTRYVTVDTTNSRGNKYKLVRIFGKIKRN